jgi:hypothetical protein
LKILLHVLANEKGKAGSSYQIQRFEGQSRAEGPTTFEKLSHDHEQKAARKLKNFEERFGCKRKKKYNVW